MDIELVRSWAGAGYLPTFQKLFETCAWSNFKHPPDYSSGTVWSSINTGLPPHKHDFYYFGRFLKESYKMRIGKPGDLRGQFYWRRLSESGRRIVIADVPFSTPQRELGGLQYWGWGQHDWTTRRESVPRRLLRDLKAQFGPHPVLSCGNYSNLRTSLRRLEADLLEGIRRRTALLCSLIAHKQWDFLYAVFCEAHCAGHLMWHLEDSAHPQHSPEDLAAIGHGVREVYSALDRALSELMAACPRDSASMIFFSHGMGPNYNADHLFQEFLRRFHQYRNGEEEQTRTGDENRAQGGFASLWQHSVGRIPTTWRKRVESLLPADLRSWLILKRDQDPRGWAGMPAFALPFVDGFSALRVNLTGREAAGRITGGDEYRAYLDALTAELFSLQHADTGEAAVDAVYRPDANTEPAAFGAAPDLMIWWRKTQPFRAIRSPLLGTIVGEPLDARSGEHVMRGMLLVSHPRAKTGYQPIDGLTALDFAPTICGLAGLEANDSLPGVDRCRDLLSI